MNNPYYQQPQFVRKKIVPENKVKDLQKIVAQQKANKDNLSLVVIAGIDHQAMGRGITFKIPRSIGVEIQRRLELGFTSLMIVRHKGDYHLKPVTKLIVVPQASDLSFAMRWAHSVIGDSPFIPLANYERGL